MVIAGLIAVVGLAVLIARRPWLTAPLVVVTLPFRIPISAGGATSNLLVPLYVVLGAASLAFIATALGSRGFSAHHGPSAQPAGANGATGGARDRSPAARWLEYLLVGYVLLYAVQSAYSLEFQRALQLQ